MAVQESSRTNWLLLWLVVLSVAGHALIFANITQLFHHHKTEYIELEVRPEQDNFTRSIPVPHRHRIAQSVIDEPTIKSVRAVSVPKVCPQQSFAKLDHLPSPVTEPIGLPDSPEIDAPKIFSWTPSPETRSQPQTPARGPIKDNESAKQSLARYLTMVRMRIEGHKRYPMLARRQHIEGRTRVSFLLRSDGEVDQVRVIKTSGYRILDDAAVAAIKNASPFPMPPNGLLHCPISLEITMVFKLI